MNRRKALGGIAAIAVVATAGIPEGTRASGGAKKDCTSENCTQIAFGDTEQEAMDEFTWIHLRHPADVKITRCYKPNSTTGEWRYIAKAKCNGVHNGVLGVAPRIKDSYTCYPVFIY